MLNRTYSCGICKTMPDQISHHKMHLETQKHADKRELFELKLKTMSDKELLQKYKTLNIVDIVNETETVLLQKQKPIKMKPIEMSGSEVNSELTYIKKEDNNSRTITQEQMIANSENITNKEALRDKIHEIHNYLRNHGAGYGMNALKVFNVLYGLKKIEEKGLIDKVQLKRPECEFSYLLGLAERNADERLAEVLFGTVLDSIHGSNIKYIMFNEIPRNLKGSVLCYLIKEINKITEIEKTCNVLLSGKIYEYFIGRDESAISELGAYFTDRHIVDYILDKLNPEIDPEGRIGSMVDMFGGSGGFTTGYIDRLVKHGERNVRWETEISKISHFDMNEDVIKSAGLEIFCMTGELPLHEKLKYANSFRDEFGGNKYKYILTNPPYGGDKNKSTDRQLKRDKVKEYIKAEMPNITDEGMRIHRQKQLKDIEAEEKQEKKERENMTVCLSSCSTRINRFARDHKLKGTDKEACSLMLMMDMLEKGGTAIGVLKEGVFFNKTYKDLRKCLIENFNVREVISVPQDQFENTSTKTSIVIFDNSDTKTSTVVFSELVVDRYENDKFADIDGKIYLAENKGDIYGVHDVEVSRASLSELLANDICSLNGKDYNKEVIQVGEGYELVKLGVITDINMGSTPSTKNHNYWENGTIPWVSIADLDNTIIYNTKKCLTQAGADSMKNRLIPTNSILLSFKLSIGKLGITGKEMYCNEAIAYLNTKSQKIPQAYLYYVLNGFDFEKHGRGTIGTHGNLNKTILENIQIPIPKSPEKIQEWVDKISAPYNESIEKRAKVKELETFVQNRIKEISETEECDEIPISELTHMLPSSKHNTSYGKTMGKYKFYNSSNEEKLFCDEYEIESESIIIGFKGNINIHYGKQFTSSQHMYILQLNDITHLKYGNIIKYLFNYFNYNKHIFTERMHGTTIKHITKNDLNNIKIKIPENKQLIQDLDASFQQIETLQSEAKLADELYKTYITELSKEAFMA